MAWAELLKDGSSCVEFAEPEFTTLVNDSDLVVQFPVSMIQTEYFAAAKSYLKTDPPIQWRALMCTDGHYHQFHSDLASGKVIRTMHLKAAMAWYAEVPVHDERPVAALAVPDGIKLDSLKTLNSERSDWFMRQVTTGFKSPERINAGLILPCCRPIRIGLRWRFA
ncbi:hypothetical protein C7T94_13625 [Pedobacter yulinensis]|uniref:Uncharacterized protein n=1 Tax=Pedobacter yulinensis TaxID=2126353 RepID=A0A2T3HMC2_9SPHI|nr:hypothetical protein [Pedobacter yulinensis]PST83576.1 hypothetical protein C7T94_13625 [Pedobacter yulinensis]